MRSLKSIGPEDRRSHACLYARSPAPLRNARAAYLAGPTPIGDLSGKSKLPSDIEAGCGL